MMRNVRAATKLSAIKGDGKNPFSTKWCSLMKTAASPIRSA